MSTVDELREEWLAKVEVAEGLTSEARSQALIIARNVANDVQPVAARVQAFRTADVRAGQAWTSARQAQAAFDQARAQAAEVPA